MSIAANDNDIIKKRETRQALEQIFPEIMPILYQGKLSTLAEYVISAANEKNITHDGMKEVMQTYAARLDQGATLDEQRAYLNDIFGNSQAAAAFMILYGVRETALSLVVHSRMGGIIDTVRSDGIALPHSLSLHAKINRLRGTLERALCDIGGVGEQASKQFVRQFENAANQALDAKMGAAESLRP